MFQPLPTQRQYHHPLLLAVVFVGIFVVARLLVHPLNTLDYSTFTRGVKAAWQGDSPYSVIGYFMPPWSVLFLSPDVNQPVETWLALDIAFFATAILDLGTPAGLLLLLHPGFITLFASSNAEWLLIGPGLWLLYRTQRGWGRGLAWLLLTCKPQSALVLLLFDGWEALRQRDWKAIGLAAVVALISFAIYPQFFTQITTPLDWSLSVLARFGVLGAIAVTGLIVAIRWKRRDDRKTLGLLLSPVWTPYMLQYSYTATALQIPGCALLRTVIYVVASLILMILFWQNYHVAEHIGALGMVLLAAILAPAYRQGKAFKPVAPQNTVES